MFQEEETYKVLSSNGEIGTLNKCPAVGEVFVLAGRSWIVISVDEERKTIYVNQTKSSRIPSWEGGGGDIHSKVFQKMKSILIEETIYPYMQKNAIKVLSDARKIAKESGILEHDIIQYADKSYFVCPWVGTKEIRTIVRMFACGLKDQLDIRSVVNSGYYLSFTSGLDTKELVKKIAELDCERDNPSLVLSNEQLPPRIDKYDYMVPDNLLRSSYLYNQVDVISANDVLNKLVW